MDEDGEGALQKLALFEAQSGPGITTADKVRFLSAAAAYPDRPERVSAKETHMSWVFLAGDHAYKLKKPVKYAFLDFSTLAARQADCSEEIRLNRRLAPSIYLGTARLTCEASGELALDGRGTTVEWLVKMRRLPAARMLDTEIEHKTVTRERIEAVADLLSDFYARAERADVSPSTYVAAFEREQALNRTVLTNPDFGFDSPFVQRVLGDVEGFLRDKPGLLEDRVQRQCVVDGHGDLRPDHVCLLDPPVIIDCLEFNRGLRLVDPFDELAFLGLECARLSAPWIRPCLMDRCAARLGDRPPDDLVAFYTSYRACLRARLALAHLAEPAPRERDKWLPLAHQYLGIADDDGLSPAPPGDRRSSRPHGSGGSPRRRARRS